MLKPCSPLVGSLEEPGEPGILCFDIIVYRLGSHFPCCSLRRPVPLHCETWLTWRKCFWIVFKLKHFSYASKQKKINLWWEQLNPETVCQHGSCLSHKYLHISVPFCQFLVAFSTLIPFSIPWLKRALFLLEQCSLKSSENCLRKEGFWFQLLLI